MQELGINIPEELCFYPFRATFDFECYFDTDHLPPNSPKVHWLAQKVKYTAVIVDEVIPETVHNRLRGDALTSVQQIHDTVLYTHIRQRALKCFVVEIPSRTGGKP